MPESLSPDRLLDLQFLLIFLAAVVVLIGLVLVVRRIAGRGQALPEGTAGRSRQPRLGIVDVYELDRTRHLILLRRDNVEHLLLVGGTNDLVVERNIVRGAARAQPDHAEQPPARSAPQVRSLAEPPAPGVRDGIPAIAAMPDLRAGPTPAATVSRHPFEPTVGPQARSGAGPSDRTRGAAPAPKDKPPSLIGRFLRRKAAEAGSPDAEVPGSGPRVSLAKHPTDPVAAGEPAPEPGATEDASPEPMMADMAKQIEAVLQGRFAPATDIAPLPRVKVGGTEPSDTVRPSATVEVGSLPATVPVPSVVPQRAAPATPAPPRPADRTPVPPPVPAPHGDPEPPRPQAREHPQDGKRPGKIGDGPFSLDDIESEFARLLGRPLDRKG